MLFTISWAVTAPLGQGKPGQPANDRQWKFAPLPPSDSAAAVGGAGGSQDLDPGAELAHTRSQEQNEAAMAALAQQLAEMLHIRQDQVAAVLAETDGDPELAVAVLLGERAA